MRGPTGLSCRWQSWPPPEWLRLLEQDPWASFAHHPDFLRALVEVLPGYEARFLEVREGDELIGGAPVVLERRAAWCWWHLMPFLLPGNPLATEGHHAEVDRACAEELARGLEEYPTLGGEWVGYRSGDPPLLGALQTVPGETRFLKAYTLDLSQGLDPAWKRMDRETRREIRHSGQRGVRIASESEALEEGYALHRRQARDWPGHRPLPLELSRRLLTMERSVLLTARDGGGLLAAVLGLASRREAFVWWSGAHPASRATHAYAALMWGAAEWARSSGCDRLSLGASTGLETVEAFKLNLGARPWDYPVRWLAARSSGPLGRLVGALQTRRRRGRHRGEPA